MCATPGGGGTVRALGPQPCLGFWAPKATTQSAMSEGVIKAHSPQNLVSAVGSLKPRKDVALSAQTGSLIPLLPPHLYTPLFGSFVPFLFLNRDRPLPAGAVADRSCELSLCGVLLALTVTLAAPLSSSPRPLGTTGCAGPAAIPACPRRGPRPTRDSPRFGPNEFPTKRGESCTVLQRRGPQYPGECAHTPGTPRPGSLGRGRGPGRARDRGGLGAPETASGSRSAEGRGVGWPSAMGARDSGVRKPSSPRGPNKLDRVREPRG